MLGRWSRARRAAARPAAARPTAALPTPGAVSEGLTVYSTSWCGYCSRLRRQLDRAGIGYIEVDIDRDPVAGVFVMAVNGGNRTVPTVVLPDGTALTNPRAKDLLARLTT